MKILQKTAAAMLSLSTVLSAALTMSAAEVSAAAADRYTVLVLDTSGSMSGTPMQKEREAAEKFCTDLLAASGDNYIALVTLNSSSTVCMNFSDDIEAVKSRIYNLYSGGGTNVNDALLTAGSLLSSVPSNCIRNIVLCSDGLPQSGSYSYSGVYDSDCGYSYYEYANAAYNTAESLKSSYNIYTLGFFHSLYGRELEFGRRFMSDLASSADNYYDVTNPEDLVFTFGSIADDVLTADTHPIIVMPGIMGSRLFTDKACTKLAWPPVLGTNLTSVGTNMQIDTLYVREAFKQTATDREYGALDCLKAVVDELCKTYPSRDIYVFSYDWRKSNEKSAEELHDFIEKLDADKVDIVAHSMGGLVTSKYYVRYGSNRIDKIITCGTPYEGAAKLLDAVEDWDVLRDLNATGSDVPKKAISDSVLGIFGGLTTAVKSKFDGVAELTPTKNYVGKTPMWKDSEKWFSKGDYALEYDDYTKILKEIFGTSRYQSAYSFQQSLHDTDGYNALLNYENAYFIVGYNYKTITAVKFQYSNNDIDEEMDEARLQGLYPDDLLYTTKGDGTVPYLSSTIMEKIPDLDPSRRVFYKTNHSGTVGGDGQEVIGESDKCVEWIKNVLGKNVPLETQNPVTGHAYVVIRIACPVDVTITDGETTLSSVAGEESFRASFGRLVLIGKDNEIKMLCLDRNTGLKVQMNGTDNGTMNYTIRYYDENDVLQSERVFENVPITKDTSIETSADDADVSVLSIDNDGDGTVDETRSASDNEAVTVSDEERIEMTGIKAAVGAGSIVAGETTKISVTKDPENATDDMDLYFSSSDKNVATVDENGVITAVGAGTAKITVTSSNGFTQEIEIKAEPAVTTTAAAPQTGESQPICLYVCFALAVLAALALRKKQEQA